MTLKVPRSISQKKTPMSMQEVQVHLHRLSKLLLHQTGHIELSESERSWLSDAVLNAIAGWKPEPYPSMDDRQEPDDDGLRSLSQRQGGE